MEGSSQAPPRKPMKLQNDLISLWKVKWILMKPSASAAMGLSQCQVRSKGFFFPSISFNRLFLKLIGSRMPTNYKGNENPSKSFQLWTFETRKTKGNYMIPCISLCDSLGSCQNCDNIVPEPENTTSGNVNQHLVNQINPCPLQFQSNNSS